jgi:Cu+-exporting ATPase
LLADHHIPLTHQDEMEQLEAEGKTVMLLANEKMLLGMIAVADMIKATSKVALQQLKKS